MAEFDSVIPAGRSGKLVAKIHTTQNLNGNLAKHIMVQTTAQSAQSFRLAINAHVSSPIIVSPRQQIHLNTMVGQSVSEKVLLHRRDGEKLRVEALEDLPDGISVTFNEVSAADEPVRGVTTQPGDLWMVVAIESPAAANNAAHRVMLKTNDPAMPELTLPVTMRIRELIEARPTQLRLWLTDQPAQQNSMVFRLNHNQAKNFEVKELSSSQPDLFSVSLATKGAAKMHTLRVELVPELDTSQLVLPAQGTVTILTTDPDAPRITVPVVVMERAQPSERGSARGTVESPSRRMIPGSLVLPTGTPGTD